jgi:DNA-binding transcriptional regulator PaaX
MFPTVQQLVIDILKYSYPIPCSIKYVLKASIIFGYSENTTRVIIHRLLKNQLIVAISRGMYTISQNAFLSEKKI